MQPFCSSFIGVNVSLQDCDLLPVPLAVQASWDDLAMLVGPLSIGGSAGGLLVLGDAGMAVESGLLQPTAPAHLG